MKLNKLTIEGYKRHKSIEVYFSDATFIIGENNSGKSSILNALELLLSVSNTKDENFYKYVDGMEIKHRDEIIITAEFIDLPIESKYWRGFKGRVFPTEVVDEQGILRTTNCIQYRKRYQYGNKNYKVEMKQYGKTLKEEYTSFTTIIQFVEVGFPKEKLEGSSFTIDDKLNTKKRDQFSLEFERAFEFFDYTEEEIWYENPGGIPQNVLSKLPKLIYIPANDGIGDLEAKGGAMREILNELFENVRKNSDNYKKAQEYLDKLAKEMNPKDNDTEFGKMMLELNSVLGGVFSGINLNAETTLTESDKSITPIFNIELESNVPTSVDSQGTGVIRSAVFGLLKYKAERDLGTKENERPLIICFEEPEIYSHPNAANLMRDTIYKLAITENNQIVCSTHSPYMIDLSKTTGQVLNHLMIDSNDLGGERNVSVKCTPFNIQKGYKDLQEVERDFVKLQLKMDDYFSRVFFCKNVLIIEGDTEEIVLKETISLMEDEMRTEILNNWQILRARGKAVIISIIKYFKATGIIPFVMHDLDLETPKAIIFNNPISEVLEDENRLFRLENCIEDILGYPAPSKDKPYKAYKFIQENWQNDYQKISPAWREIVEKIFNSTK